MQPTGAFAGQVLERGILGTENFRLSRRGKASHCRPTVGGVIAGADSYLLGGPALIYLICAQGLYRHGS